MSLRALVEILIHCESFRNVGLTSSGLYFMKFHVYYLTKSKSAISAYPIGLYGRKDLPEIKKTKLDYFDIEPAKLDDDKATFSTKIFAIRFCEEEIEIDDFCQLRCEIDVSDNYLGEVFYLEVDLMYGENNIIKELEADSCFKLRTDQLNKFTSIAKKKYILNEIPKGISEYLGINFEKENFSIANIMVHSSIVDYRFRITPLNYVITEEKLKELSNNTKDSKGQCYINKLVEFLFGKMDKKTNKKLDLNVVDAVYKDYVKVMKVMYDKMYAKFFYFHERVLSDKEQKQYSLAVNMPPFICPGSENESNMFKIDVKQPKLEKSECDVTNDNISAMEESKMDFEENKFNRQGDDTVSIISNSDSICISDIDEKTNNINLPQMKSHQKSAEVAIPPLFKQANTQDPQKIVNKFMLHINLLGGLLLQTWNLYIELLRYSPKFVCELMKLEHYHQAKIKWSEFIFKTIMRVPSYNFISEKDIGEIHARAAKEKRANAKYQNKSDLCIEDEQFVKNIKSCPIVFEEIYNRPSSKPKPQKPSEELGLHLFVLVHGFQGNQLDMHILRNNILLHYPEHMVLCSKDNEAHTDGDIDEMGKRLANEVENFINENCPESVLTKLSFIGFSIGGVICRAAIPFLLKYKDKMVNFITFSSPHLGTITSLNHIVDAGMWIIKKWKKSISLLQLCMDDFQNYKDSLIYKLSNNNALSYFKNIILAGSHEDQYVPFESARIEITQKIGSDHIKGNIIKEMVSNVWKNVEADTVHRLDVDFLISEKSLDSFIGRAAHILFLDSDYLMKILIYRFSEYFE